MPNLEQKQALLDVLENCTCEFVGNTDGLPCGYFEDGWNEYLASLVKIDIEYHQQALERLATSEKDNGTS